MTRILARALLRPLAPGMNKLEARFADLLEARRKDGLIREWRYEAVTLKLADDTRYTPDFFVVRSDGMVEFYETKGFFREDAAVKIKVAARQFPFRFKLVKWSKAKGWETTDYTEAE